MRGGNVQALLGIAVVFALAWGAPAGAVIIASGDGSGNTSAPVDDPGWGNVVNLNGLTGVYLGNGWVLTANHVGARDMIIGSEVYEPVPGSKVQLQTGGSNADLALFQIVRDPWLPDVVIRASSPSPGSEVVMIGRGYSRGASISACTPPRQGWLWQAPHIMRWGTNVVANNGIDLSTSGALTRAFSTEFSGSRQTGHEAQAAHGDSGGAVFVKNGGTWELAGIMAAIDAYSCQPSSSAFYGNYTFAADLSFYLNQINATASVPACNDGIDQDGDGRIDWNGGPQGEPADPGCDDLNDPFETSDALPCDDGRDNDGDGGVDFDPVTYANPGDETTPPSGGGDPGCEDPTWSTESPQCQDGLNNDPGQDPDPGSVDYDGGQSIHGYCSAGTCPPGVSDPEGDGVANPDPQCVGNPSRNSETQANSCGLGVELALLLPALMWLSRRRRRSLGSLGEVEGSFRPDPPSGAKAH